MFGYYSLCVGKNEVIRTFRLPKKYDKWINMDDIEDTVYIREAGYVVKFTDNIGKRQEPLCDFLSTYIKDGWH